MMRTNMLRRRIGLLFIAIFFAACSGQPTAVLPQTDATPAVPQGQLPSTSIALEPATPTALPPVGTDTPVPTLAPTFTPTPLPLNPLQIEWLREQMFPGSDIKIEQTLAPGSNYNRYIASYQSEGYKIYALLTVPLGQKPKTGWPVIIFNHGFIPPTVYRTTERYIGYVDALARNGYIVFKSDYRGHGDSEGSASGGYGSPAYTIDILNALASLKHYADADPNRIGMWGHSMGGQVTLRAMVTSKDIKAGVIWSGVVGTYTDLIYNWRRPNPTFSGGFPIPSNQRRWRQDLINVYGTPEQNPTFWASISPNTYVADLPGPIQLHHGLADEEVPLLFSQELYDQVKQAGKPAEFYTYPGSDHNISQGFTLAMQRTIAFFDKYVSQSH